MSGQRAVGGTSGGVVAIIGGLTIGLAYVFLPVATIPLIGSVNASDLASAAPQATSLSLLHIVPVAALITLGIGLWLVLGKPDPRAQRGTAIALVVCAVAVAIAYLWPFARLQDELSGSGVSSDLGVTATTFTGIGFWLAIVAAIVTAAAAFVEVTGARAAGRASAH